jgi:hypothetical protein
VRSLSSVATDYWELSDDSKLLLCVLCERVLQSALELGLSFEDAIKVFLEHRPIVFQLFCFCCSVDHSSFFVVVSLENVSVGDSSNDSDFRRRLSSQCE